MRPVLFFLLLLAATAASAVEDADRDAVRGTIERQIEAFRRDDGEAAYAFAAPGIRQLFPTVERFMSMVREGYRPVYRPRSVAFGATEATAEGGLRQSVEIRDEDGMDWVALYTLEKDADGAWKITGCVLLKAPGRVV